MLSPKSIEKEIKLELKSMLKNKLPLDDIFKKFTGKANKKIINKCIKIIVRRSESKIKKEEIKIQGEIKPHTIIDVLLSECFSHSVTLGGLHHLNMEEVRYILLDCNQVNYSRLQDIIVNFKNNNRESGIYSRPGPAQNFYRINKTRIRNYKKYIRDKKKKRGLDSNVNSYIDRKILAWEKEKKIKFIGDNHVEYNGILQEFKKLKTCDFIKLIEVVFLTRIESIYFLAKETIKEMESLPLEYNKEFIRKTKDIVTRIKTYRNSIVDSIYFYDIDLKDYEFQKEINPYYKFIDLGFKLLKLDPIYINFKYLESYLESLKGMNKQQLHNEYQLLLECERRVYGSNQG